MISGVVNEFLLPIIPVSVKKLDGDWQKLDILLDTGAEVGLVLGRSTINRHGIAIGPDCSQLATIDPVDLPDTSIPLSPFWVELLLEGYPRPVEAEIRELHHLSGLIGTHLLQGRRITMDVVKNGTVNIDWIPAPTRLARIRSLIRRPERQLPSLEYVWKLPWVDVAIRDSEGRCQTLSANVDTGCSEQLSLSPSYVERFGFRLLDECRVITAGGTVDVNCGEVGMFWQGGLRTVECVQRQEGHPPLIGMKLLCGNRITIEFDFDYLAPAVAIAPIPRSASSNKGFLQSFTDRLRHRLATWSWRRG